MIAQARVSAEQAAAALFKHKGDCSTAIMDLILNRDREESAEIKPPLTIPNENYILDDRDVELVVNQAEVSSERAITALRKRNGDIVDAIMDLINGEK